MGEKRKKDLKEIEGLLDKTDPGYLEDAEEEKNKVKKYVKLVLPHVGLVLVVGIYAAIFAAVFYKFESPHEDRVKAAGVERILLLRAQLVQSMWNSSGKGDTPKSHADWVRDSERRLEKFTRSLYSAFKSEFVRYHDVPLADLSASDGEERGSKKLWTTPSSIFFAATTMATIGYGNIVPVTSTGRIICVFFALLGAPLAIITIGDLGKFLSECTIWLYKKLKLLRAAFKARWDTFIHGKQADEEEGNLGDSTSSPAKSDDSGMDLDELIMDKTEVPVLLVFTILLVYIAFGAVLFSILEEWSYVDSFYFCFITLTTVGFGDLVPDKHQYILLMLLYIGVGLAVTTMCIDLVGIQYIQKIHYFGRKFRGTDLLQLLRRRKMMERHFALTGQNTDQIIQVFLDKQNASPSPPSEWIDSVSWEVDNVFTYEEEPKEKAPTPIATPSPIATSPSIYQREGMYDLNRIRFSEWSESGPDISLVCSLHTPSSVYDREQMYNPNFWLRSPSATSYKFEFPVDLKPIADAAKTSRKTRSCPGKILPSPPPSPFGLSSMENWDSFKELEEEYKIFKPPQVTIDIPSPSDDDIDPPSLLSALSTPVSSPGESDLDFGAFEITSDIGLTAEELVTSDEPLIYHENLPVHSVHHQTVKTESVVESLMNCPESVLNTELPPVVVSDNYCFIVDGDRVRMSDIMGDNQWWRHTSRPTKYYHSEDMKQFHKVNTLIAKGKIIAARFPTSKLSPAAHRLPTASDAIHSRRSFSSTPASARSSFSGPETPSSSTEVTFHHALLPQGSVTEQDLPLEKCYKVVRFYSFWKTCTSFHRIVTLIAPADDEKNPAKFKKRIFVQYLWRNAKEADKKKVQREFDLKRQKLLKHVKKPPGSQKKSGTSRK